VTDALGKVRQFSDSRYPDLFYRLRTSLSDLPGLV
jgi:hypothetical protein